MSAPTPIAGVRLQRRRGVVRAVIAAVAVLLGVVQAFVWSIVAPGQQVLVYQDGSSVSLPTADFHPFDGLALAAFAGAAIGLIVAVAAWRVRAIRGALTLVTVGADTAAGAALCYLLGPLLAGGVDPAAVGATGSPSIVIAGPSMATPLVMVIEPLFAIAAYTFLAAWDGRTDLGVARAVARETPAAPTDVEPVSIDDEQPAAQAASEYDEQPAEQAADALERQADQGAEGVGDAHGGETAADVTGDGARH
jgi:hypothetical protein